MSYKNIAAALLPSLALLAPPSYANICPVQPAPTNGCSTMYTEYLSPEVAVFRQVFEGQCNQHDICYSTLGQSRDTCDGDFRGQMRQRCDDKFNRWLRPGEWMACKSAAEAFYGAVNAFGDRYYPGMQRVAQGKSATVAGQVDREECGTTPERTGLYGAGMLDYVKNSFAARTGRAPSIFEYFAAINYYDPAGDAATWRTMVDQYASQRVGRIPPVLAYTRQIGEESVLLQASGGGSYHWKINGTDSYAATKDIYFGPALYNDINVSLKGFVSSTVNGERGMAIVDTAFVKRAECPPPNHICR